MTLKSLLLVVCALSGNVFGQSTLSNGKLVYNYPFAPSEGIVNRMDGFRTPFKKYSNTGGAGRKK